MRHPCKPCVSVSTYVDTTSELWVFNAEVRGKLLTMFQFRVKLANMFITMYGGVLSNIWDNIQFSCQYILFSCASKGWEFDSLQCLQGEEPASVTLGKLHKSQDGPIEVGKPPSVLSLPGKPEQPACVALGKRYSPRVLPEGGNGSHFQVPFT